MQTTTMIHLDDTATVEAEIQTRRNGERYLLLRISESLGGPHLTIFPAGPEFLDKLANECERVTREFVGDVPRHSPDFAGGYLDGVVP